MSSKNASEVLFETFLLQELSRMCHKNAETPEIKEGENQHVFRKNW